MVAFIEDWETLRPYVAAMVEEAGCYKTVARRLGVSRSAVSRWCSGISEPRGLQLTMVRIAVEKRRAARSLQMHASAN